MLRLYLGFIALCLQWPTALADTGMAVAALEGGSAAPEEAIPAAEDVQGRRLPAPPASRGQMLYENHCTGCHESVLFVRQQRSVRDLDELRATIIRWLPEARVSWGDEEINDVATHLNRTFYGFAEPQSE